MTRIAIVGMACVFPGAPDLDAYWRNIVAGVEAISDVPPERWEPSFYDPDSTAIDRFYCKRGGFVDAYARFDPTRFGVMPRAAEAADPDQLLALKLGFDALADAGYGEREFARARTGVVIGRGNYVSAGVLRLEQHVRLLPQLMATLSELFPGMPEAALEEARAKLAAKFSYYGPDVAAGMIPNLIASRIANRLDLHGPAYTVDAACASSIIALEQATAALASGEADLMLVGGVHLTHDLTFWATFCQLGALSRRGRCSPFSAEADGILAGEGVGMVVLKRLDDALRDGDRVYAAIEGVGTSSDGRASSLVAPSVEGQLLALEKAWGGLDFGRASIGLVEAHGTGTPTGDVAELDTLRGFFGGGADLADGERPALGSVKSMIGHTMPAAGIAGLIKAALAVYHGVLPPTLHCDTPHPKLAETRFRALARAEEWRRPAAGRVAAVNAFGFGGINGHVVLRGVAAPAPVAPPAPPEVWLLAAASPAELLARLERGERDAHPNGARCRLAIVEPDAKNLALAKKAVASGKPWHGRQQIYFSPDGLLNDGGKLAFVFPGVDSRFAPQAEDLARFFGRPLPPYCETLDPKEALLPVAVGLLGFNRYLHDLLRQLHIVPDAMAGHSIGEWSAMLAAGMMDQATSDRANAELDFDAMRFPDVLFLAASCDVATLAGLLDDLPEIALSHDNCPNQVIACGAHASVDRLAERLRDRHILHSVLPIVSGFHSPLFAGTMDWYRDFFGRAELVEPAVPVWSATTAQRFPSGLEDKRQLALDHLLRPVRFRELVEALYADGCRVFVQVGFGSLTGFVNDTLAGRPHLALAANNDHRSGLAQLTQLCAALWVEGARFDTRLLASAQPVTAGRDIALRLGVPLVHVDTPLTWQPPLDGGFDEPEGEAAGDPVEAVMRATLADIARASAEVRQLWQRRRAGLPPAPRRVDSRETRLLDRATTIPWVDDHALYPQRPGWPVAADRHPVVPMTMEIMLLVEAAEAALPGMAVAEVRAIQAYNWLVVAEPVEAEILLKSLDDSTVAAEIAGYFRCELVLSDTPVVAPPTRPAPLARPRAPRITATALYRDQWMFHGPAYQGVKTLGPMGENGIAGELVVPEGQGALLDNMGQLAGYWVMEQPENCLAMPIGLDRARFFGGHPLPGEVLTAQVRVRELDALNCVTDHVLTDAQGRVRVILDGWRTRRYQMDEAFWLASRQLDRMGVSHVLSGRVALFEDRYDTAILRDYLARRYLAAVEMAVYEALPPRRRRPWLNGRVAAKDAVRHYLRASRGIDRIHPKECVIENAENGAPRVRSNVTDLVPPGLRLSLAHKDGWAVAIVAEAPVGVDLETLAERDPGFGEFAFAEAELEWLAGEPDAVAWTRGWVAKEVCGKRLETGIGGQLRRLVIEARDGDRLCVNGHWVATRRFRDLMLGWSADLDMDDTVAGALAALASPTQVTGVPQ